MVVNSGDMELKQIELEKIFPNFSQPREKFDKEKIRELAESILGNGLINPITIRQDGKKFFIVTGERRWTAYNVAKLKKIEAFVKEYKNEGEWMIESLIENVHRENLDPFEKAKYMEKIMNIERLDNYNELSKRINISVSAIKKVLQHLDADESIVKKVPLGTLQARQVREIATIKDKSEQIKLARIAEKMSVPETDKVVSIIKKSSKEIKDALFKEEITIEQAERISKLKDESSREKAIQEHKSLAVVEQAVEKNVEQQMSAKEKREFDKGLMKASNWITSFRNSVSSSRSELERTIKILLVATKFVGIMDDKQKERLDTDLDRFIEMLERGEQLANQIKDQL